jgi:hypothetical protein
MKEPFVNGGLGNLGTPWQRLALPGRSSPIEPSSVGGGKIARAISRLIERHDFQREGSRVFI